MTEARAGAGDRIEELDALRGLMALWVVLGHLLSVSGFDPSSWVGPLKLLGRGTAAVDVFIILSGFVIWALLDRGGEGYPAFIARRFFRLYPVYLLCLAASILTLPLAVSALESLPWGSVHNATRLQIFADSLARFPAQLAAHAVMLHGVFPDGVLPSSPYAFAGQAWSISLEWQFYLAVPLLFWWTARAPWRLAVLVVASLLLAHLAAGWPVASLPPKLSLFVLGMLSYELWTRRSRIPRARAAWLLPVTAALALLSWSVPILIWSLVLSSMLAVRRGTRGLAERSVVRALLDRRLRLLGEISYSLYLSHMIVLYLVIYLIAGQAQALGRAGFLALLAVAVLPLSIGLSALLYRYVERPGIRLGRRVALSLAEPAPMLASRARATP